MVDIRTKYYVWIVFVIILLTSGLIQKNNIASVKQIVINKDDFDNDSIFDVDDPYPFDFNNDGLSDDNTIGYNNNTYGYDADGDNITDFPEGNDYYLNTTIPKIIEIPSEYHGKKISIWIGPSSLCPPINITAIGGDGYIKISWDTVSGKNISGYNIYRRTNGQNSYIRINENNIQQNYFLDKEVYDSIIYYYIVKTINITGAESRYSLQVNASLNNQHNNMSIWDKLIIPTTIIIIILVVIYIGRYRSNKTR